MLEPCTVSQTQSALFDSTDGTFFNPPDYNRSVVLSQDRTR